MPDCSSIKPIIPADARTGLSGFDVGSALCLGAALMLDRVVVVLEVSPSPMPVDNILCLVAALWLVSRSIESHLEATIRALDLLIRRLRRLRDVLQGELRRWGRLRRMMATLLAVHRLHRGGELACHA